MLITIINIYWFVLYNNCYVFFFFFRCSKRRSIHGVRCPHRHVACRCDNSNTSSYYKVSWKRYYVYRVICFFRKVLWSGDVANIYKEQGFYIVLWGNMVAAPDETRTGDPWTLRNHTHTHAHAYRTLTHSHSRTHIQT